MSEYRDGRAAWVALDEISKIKGVARRTGVYEIKDKKNRLAIVQGYELATGDRARDVKRHRALGTAIGVGVGGTVAGAAGVLTGEPIVALGAAAGGALFGGLGGYAGGDESGWAKARGISGKKTDLYGSPQARKKGIREYQKTGKRPKEYGNNQRKDSVYQPTY